MNTYQSEKLDAGAGNGGTKTARAISNEASVQNEPSQVSVRMQAAATHLLISAAIAAGAFALVRFVWYPGPYWKMAGGQALFFLVVSVDVVSGPVITGLVFDRRKSSRALLVDLAVIGVVQLVALSYGIFTIAEARPTFMVYNVDQFTLVRSADPTAADLAQAEQAQFRTASWSGPELIGTRRATGAERLMLIDSALAGRDVAVQPKYYVPYQSVTEQVVNHAKDIATLKKRNPNKAAQIDALVRALGRSPDSVVFLPTIARGDWVVILDAKSAAVLDYWPLSGF